MALRLRRSPHLSGTIAGQQAENITPPTAGTTPGEGVTAISTTTAASTVDLYAAADRPYEGYFDRYISVMACSSDCYVLFDDDSTNGIDETVAHATLVTSGTAETVPWLLKDGVPQMFRLTKGSHRYMHLKAASGTPIIRIYPSSHKMYNK